MPRYPAVALLAAMFASLAAVADAAESQSIGITPTSQTDWLRYSVLPGESIEDSVMIFNRLDIPVKLRIYAVDALVTPQGGFALREQHEERVDVGLWASTAISNVTLQGGEKRRVKIRIDVPSLAEPGDHAGGIVIERAQQDGEASDVGDDFSVQFNIIERVGLRTFVKVEGVVRRELTAGPLTWTRDGDFIDLSLPVRNTGNIRVVPEGDVLLQGFGLPKGSYELSAPELLLPASENTMQARVPASPFLAWGSAEAIVSYGGAELLRASTDIHIIPILFLLLALAGLLLLSLIIWRTGRFIRRARVALRTLSSTSGSDPEGSSLSARTDVDADLSERPA